MHEVYHVLITVSLLNQSDVPVLVIDGGNILSSLILLSCQRFSKFVIAEEEIITAQSFTRDEIHTSGDDLVE